MLRESSVAIDALLHPASIAIVGASTTSYVGRVLCENLRDLGYEGEVYPINPRYERILDWRCFASLDELPEAPEAVVSAVRIDLAAGTLAEDVRDVAEHPVQQHLATDPRAERREFGRGGERRVARGCQLGEVRPGNPAGRLVVSLLRS